MSAIQVASLLGVLNLQDNMTPSLNSALGNARTFGSSIGGAITGNVQRLGNVMLGATAVGATAITGMVARGLGEFGTLQRGMNEVFTLMPGITSDSMGIMTQDVRNFAERFGSLPEDVVPALYQALSAGVPPDNVFAFLETAQMAATGGVTDLQTSVDGISSVINAYGQDVIGATQASDLMFTAVRLGKTNFEDLSSSLFNVIPTASSLGVGFDNVTAGLAAITAQGVPTSVATTQMRQMFVELGDSATGIGATFQQVSGSSFQEFIAGGGDVAGALQLMYDHANDTGLNIDQLFSSVEAGSAALALTGQGAGRFTDFLGQMQNSTGATDGAFTTMNSGISRSMDFLTASFRVFLSNVGSVFAPVVEPIIGLLTTFFRIINEGLDSGNNFSDWIADLPTPLRQVGFIVGNVSAWFYNLGVQFTNLTSNISAGMSPIAALQQMFWSLGIPPTLATGIGNLVTGIQSLVSPIASFIQQNVQMSDVLIGVGIAIGSVVVPAVLSIVAPIVGTFALLVGAVALLRTAWENNVFGIQDKVSAFATWFTTTAMPGVIGFINTTVIPGITSFTDTIVGIWNDVSPTLTSLYDWFMSTGLPMISDFLGATIIPAMDLFTSSMSTIWETVSPYLGDLYNWFMDTGLPAIEEYITGPFTTSITGLTTFLSSIWDLISPGITLFQDNIVGAFTFIIDEAIGPLSDALGTAWDAYSDFTTWSGNALDSAGNFINGIIPGGNNSQVGGTGQPDNRYTGGPVTARRPYIVGERGPELFTPSTSGTITNNRDTQAAMSGGGGDSFNFYGDIIANEPDTFLDTLEERRRRRN